MGWMPAPRCRRRKWNLRLESTPFERQVSGSPKRSLSPRFYLLRPGLLRIRLKVRSWAVVLRLSDRQSHFGQPAPTRRSSWDVPRVERTVGLL
jgi:hypothetical protein